MRPSFRLATLLLLTTVACTPAVDNMTGDTPPPGGGSGGGSGGPNVDPGKSAAITVDEKYTACNTSADCKMLEVGCCDVCNGGPGISVNKAFADEAYQKYKQSCSPDWACTLMACPPPIAYCKEKKCAFLKSPDLVRKCQKDEDCTVMKGGRCCDNCGTSVDAINKEFVELYSLPQFTNADCSQIVCTKDPSCPELIPIEWSTICNNGYCLPVGK